ncbi:TolC family outer membrane protein [Metapseudomonas furukawaii]|uniref:TolC family outer membrane protein n=1 Tax=Metapseudomonas furukawaii TaxID=1149133 RepID=UPI004045EA32
MRTIANMPPHWLGDVLARRRAGDERLVQGRAGLLPQISLDAQTSWSETEYRIVNGTTEHRRQNRSYGVQLVQPLLRRQNWILYELGGLQKNLAEIHTRIAGQALILRVAEAYFRVLNFSDVIDALRQLQESEKQLLASARKNFELGNASITDVHEAQTSHDMTAAQLVKARSEFALARQGLARITSKQPATLKGLDYHVTLSPPQPTNIDEWITAAERENLDVQMQELLLHIATSEVRSRKAEHLPTVDIVLSQRMQKSPGSSTERSTSTVIGLRFNMPLFSGGRSISSTREATALRFQAEYELEDAKRGAAMATREAWSGVMDGMAQVQALEVARASAEAAVRANRLGYHVGVRDSADVLEIQSQLSDILKQLYKARYDVLLAHLRLKSAVGTLATGDLEVINTLLGRIYPLN